MTEQEQNEIVLSLFFPVTERRNLFFPLTERENSLSPLDPPRYYGLAETKKRLERLPDTSEIDLKKTIERLCKEQALCEKGIKGIDVLKWCLQETFPDPVEEILPLPPNRT